MAPGQVLKTHSSRDIAEWIAYFNLEAEDNERTKRESDAVAAVQASQSRPGRFR